MTYRELNARANRLAHHLRRHAVKPGARVAICMDRGVEMVVSLLATLKAGGAYVPLDPTYPAERLTHMLEDSAPVAVLVDRAGCDAVTLAGSFTAPRIQVENEAVAWAEESTRNPSASDVGLGATAVAYVIYTSGSTGKPKGVCVGHQGVVNFLTSMAREPGLGGEDVLLAVTTLSFDIAVLELYLPLSVGARVVLATRDEARDPARCCERSSSVTASR